MRSLSRPRQPRTPSLLLAVLALALPLAAGCDEAVTAAEENPKAPYYIGETAACLLVDAPLRASIAIWGGATPSVADLADPAIAWERLDDAAMVMKHASGYLGADFGPAGAVEDLARDLYSLAEQNQRLIEVIVAELVGEAHADVDMTIFNASADHVSDVCGLAETN